MPFGLDAPSASMPPPVPDGPPEITDKLLALFRTGQLDPAKTPGDPYADEKLLLKTFEDCHQECFENRWVYERSWWRDLLYLLGRHWIYYDTNRGQWMDKRLAKWIPRPVTNKVAEVHQTIMSLFEAVDLIAKCRPTGNRPKDISAAEIADKEEPAIAAEHRIKKTMRLADFWLIATGNVFLHPWWDKYAEDATTAQPFETCPFCQVIAPGSDFAEGTCPRCDMPVPPPEMGGLTSVGKGRTDVLSPWELAFPGGYNLFEEVPYVIRPRWRAKTWVQLHYPELAATLNFAKGSSEKTINLLKSLASMNDLASNATALLAGAGMEQGEGITEYELWMKPTRTFARGLFLRVFGDGPRKIIYDEGQSLPGPLPYATPQDTLIWPWIHVPYERIGGRVWARGPLSPIIQKNDQLNQLDSLVQLIVQRSSNPIWLEPKGAEVKKFSGEPGLVVKYNPLIAAGNAKPERIEGSNVPHSLNALRQQYLADIELLAGVQDVLKGAKPAGVEAFSAMQLLVERSQSRFGMVLGERGEGYRKWYQIALELERAYGPEERFFAVIGPNGTWQGDTFRKADLDGAIQIIIEDGSQAPKTNLGKRAAIQQLQQLQLLNPQDPDQSYAILRTFGQTELLPSLDADVKSALQEQDAFERWAMSDESIMQPPQPEMDPLTGAVVGIQPSQPLTPSPFARKAWQNDAIHISEHRKWALQDSTRELFAQRPELEQVFVQHMAETEYWAMMTQQGMPRFAPPPMMGAGGAQAMQNSNVESGNPADVQEQAQGTEGLPPG